MRSLVSKTCFAATVLLFVGLISILAPQLASGQSPTPTPTPASPALDLVLLIDSSGSTASTDRDNLRVNAAYFLLDYIQAIGEAQGVTHRFAAANFNTQVLDKIELTELKGDAAKGKLVVRSQGGTDFGAPLEFALQQRNKSDKQNPMAVVLFTDGRPDPAPDLAAYFQGLTPTLSSLQQPYVQVFVVAMGDTPDVQAQWTRVVPPAHYRSVNATTDLAGVYHEFLASLLGLRTEARPTLLADGTEHIVTLEPYLEQVVFSVIKDNAKIQVTLLDPNKATVPPSRAGGETDLHVIYTVVAPAPGTWRVQVKGGTARLYVDRRLPTLTLDVPTGPQTLGSPIDVTGRLIYRGQTVKDAGLTLQLMTVAPDEKTTYKEMERQADGRYTFALTDLKTAGTFTLTLSARLGGQPLEAQIVSVVMQVLVAPVATATNTPTVMPTATTTPTPTPTSTPPPFDFPTPPARYQWWIIGLMMGVFIAIYLWWRYIRPYRKWEQSLQKVQGLTQDAALLAKAKKYDEADLKYQEAIVYLEQFLKDSTQQVTSQFREIYDDWLSAFKDQPERRLVIIRKQADTEDMLKLKGLAQALTNLWQGKEGESVRQIYDEIITNGTNVKLLEAISQTENNLLANLFSQIYRAKSLQAKGELTPEFLRTTIVPIARGLPQDSGRGLEEAYLVLAALIEHAPLDKPFQEFSDAGKILHDCGPDIVCRIVESANDVFTLPLTPEQGLERLHAIRTHLLNGRERIRGISRVPEVDLFVYQDNRWIDYVEAQIVRSSRPGELVAEFVASLNTEFAEEKPRESGGWELALPVRVTNVGNMPIQDVKVYLEAKEGQTVLDVQPKDQSITSLSPGQAVGLVFRFDFLRAVDIYLKAEYKRAEVDSEFDKADLRTRYFSPKDPLHVDMASDSERPPELSNPYVPDRPLVGDEEWQSLGKGNARERVNQILEKLESIDNFGQIISVRGLRRVGKTTVILQTLQRANRELRKDARPKFVAVYVDLLTWLGRLDGLPETWTAPLDTWLWREILVEFRRGLREYRTSISDEKTLERLEVLAKDLDEMMDGSITTEPGSAQLQPQTNGAPGEKVAPQQSKGLGINWDRFRDVLQRSRLEIGATPLIVLDEADSFADPRFEKKSASKAVPLSIISNSLRILTQQDGVVVILAHDVVEAKWKEYFQNVIQPIPDRLYLLEEPETCQLAKQGPLRWTPMGLKALWQFTGGYPALVQLICYYLVEHAKENLVITSSNVKRAIARINTSEDWAPLVDYLRYGFCIGELNLLMTLAAGGFTDLDTMRIRGIEMKEGAWSIDDSIQDKFAHHDPEGKADLEDLREWLSRLEDKQIFERQPTGHNSRFLSWRVGWLYSLMCQRSQMSPDAQAEDTGGALEEEKR